VQLPTLYKNEYWMKFHKNKQLIQDALLL